MKHLKLYPILFENDGKKEYINYSDQDFALFVHDSTFVLVNQQAYEELIVDRVKLPLDEWCAGAIEIRKPQKNCQPAREIEQVVASGKFPGAGSLLYALSSKYLGVYLTSDRVHSTTDSAKKSWSKIENSGDWQKLALDNFYLQQQKTFVDIEGSHPEKRIANISNNPKTQDPSDDCILPAPKKGMKNVKIGNTIDELGTENAYMYSGPLDPNALIKAGRLLIRNISEKAYKSPNDLVDEIIQGGEELFNQRYEHD